MLLNRKSIQGYGKKLKKKRMTDTRKISSSKKKLSSLALSDRCKIKTYYFKLRGSLATRVKAVLK